MKNSSLCVYHKLTQHLLVPHSSKPVDNLPSMWTHGWSPNTKEEKHSIKISIQKINTKWIIYINLIMKQIQWYNVDTNYEDDAIENKMVANRRNYQHLHLQNHDQTRHYTHAWTAITKIKGVTPSRVKIDIDGQG